MTTARNILITGANTGLGFQIVRALCQSPTPFNIILAGRSPSKVQDAIEAAQKEFPTTTSKLHATQIDLESDESIQAAASQVKGQFEHLDALINNGGAQFDQGFWKGEVTEREMWNRSWDVNVAGTQVLTTALVPLLLESADPRLVFITSGTATLTGSDNLDLRFNKSPAAGWPKQGPALSAYRSVKTGLNMAMREWHRILRDDGVKVWSISPGMLATGLGLGDPEALRKMGAGNPDVVGPFIISILNGERDADVGKVIMRDSVIQPW